MEKPCGHDDAVEGCRICFLGATDERYARLFGTVLSEPIFPCVHLGNATKEFVECQSCPKENKQAVPVHSCAIHGRCAPAIDRHLSVKGCGKCEQRESARPVIQTVKVHIPNQPHAFNPSIINYRGRLLFCYRSRWAGSTLWVCELDRKTLQPTSAGVRLNLQHARCRSGQEDPRLFMFRDRLHVQFSGVESRNGKTVVNIMFAILSDSLSVEHVWEPNLVARAEWEKNWQTFDFERELFSVYHPFRDSSHQIISHKGDIATMTATIPWTPKWPAATEIRGGASPVRVGDEYWCFFHDTRYQAGLYTFDAAPPFRPRRMVPTPLLTPNGGPGKPVVFPGGAVKDGDRWLVAFGRNDQHTEIAVLDHAVLQKLLVRVHAPMNLPNDPNAPELLKTDEFGDVIFPDDQHAPPVYREVCQEDAYGLHGLRDSGMTVKTAIDLGASYGVASRMIQHFWPQARILAFEPDALRFRYLTRNCPGVECRRAAVAGFAGDRERMLAGIGLDRRKWRVEASEAIAGLDCILSVREAFASVEQIDLLKIDVEGFELGIIQEMRELGLLAKTKMIVGEWHFQNALEGLREAFQDTHEFSFEPAGSNPWNLFRANLQSSMIFCTPKESPTAI